MTLFESGRATAIAVVLAASCLAALAFAIATLLEEAFGRAGGADRRRLLKKSLVLFKLAAAAFAAVALLRTQLALQVAAAIVGGAILIAGAVQLRRILLEFASSPAIGALEAVNARLNDELERRAVSEADLARRNDEIHRSNDILREAAVALRASEERLAIAVEAGRVGLWDLNLRTGETWCSPQWFAMLGRPGERAECGFDAWRAAVPVAEGAKVRAAIEAHLKTGAPFNSVFRVTTPEGGERWLEATGRAHCDANGSPLRMAGAVIDITESRHAQEMLMRREAFERAVLESIGDGIVACDEHGRLVLFNRAAREFHGVDAESDEWPARYNLFAVDGKTPLAPQAVPLARAFEGETINSEEMVIAPHGRRRRLVLVHAAPLIDRSGRRIGAVAAMRDVTRERAALAEAARRTRELELVFQHVPVALWYVDEAGNVVRVNAETAAALGLSADSVEGRRLADLPPAAAHFLGAGATGSVEKHVGPDGAPRWLKAHRVPFADEETGERLHFVSATDITQMMQVKEELRRSNEELDQFARAASHDLREPLRKILFFSDFLARDHAGALPDEARRDLDVIVGAARRMEAIIGGFLSLARIGAGSPALAPIEPEICIRAAIHQVHVPPDRTVRFAYNPMPPVLGDHNLLVQVFQNLISNAVKFTRPTDSVEITFTAAADGADAILGVADNGIGVPASHRSQIFEPLTRLHPREAYDGTGIGLALCRKSVERLGGEIWMEESAAGGAHVRMRLRRAA